MCACGAVWNKMPCVLSSPPLEMCWVYLLPSPRRREGEAIPLGKMQAGLLFGWEASFWKYALSTLRKLFFFLKAYHKDMLLDSVELLCDLMR